LFTSITYTADRQERRADFDKLLESTGTTSFIVVQNGSILYEKYFNGFQRDSIVTSFSSVKSIVSTLIGLAIDEGLIHSVDDPVIEYVPELKGRGLDNLTIKHLLMMSSGIKYVEDERYPFFLGPLTDDAKTYYFPDLRQVALSAHAGDEPIGEIFITTTITLFWKA
jgi:CubicO group peptidase (beta-lactamase class C family)